MTFNFTTRLFVTVLTISSSLVLTSELGFSQTSNTDATTFLCIREGNNFATVARRGDRQTGPMIVWKSNIFGPNFPPQKRCQIVSQRLTEAVLSSGGRLNQLRITSGQITSGDSSVPVICYIRNTEEQCNPDNLLLTLTKADIGKENEIIQQLFAFSTKGTSAPLSRGPGSDRTVVELGQIVDDNLKGLGTVQAQPSGSNIPITIPHQPSKPSADEGF